MHVAIIMDGNGRWAEQRGLLRTVGHHAGARAVRRVVEAAARSSVDLLTLYAFSSDNWSRPRAEVQNLMTLFRRYLQSEVARCVENGIRIRVIGRRDRLGGDLVRIIEQAERLTADCRRMTLQLAVDYSAREAIARAALALAQATREPRDVQPAQSSTQRPESEPAVGKPAVGRPAVGRPAIGNALAQLGERIAAAIGSPVTDGKVDLLIRTGGERRLSDFLLWESAYAELVFLDTYWPDFDEQGFFAALAEFRHRQRRFGGLPGRPQSAIAEMSS